MSVVVGDYFTVAKANTVVDTLTEIWAHCSIRCSLWEVYYSFKKDWSVAVETEIEALLATIKGEGVVQWIYILRGARRRK